jgi:hypothetical protein
VLVAACCSAARSCCSAVKTWRKSVMPRLY